MIRNKGIPHDDDIDVGMLEDYNKLIRLKDNSKSSYILEKMK